MKKFKIYLSIFLVLCITFCNISVLTINANSLTDNTVNVIEVEKNPSSEDELQPIMARGCGYYLSGKPYVPDGANLVRADKGANTSSAFLAYVSGLGYVNGTWEYAMETWGIGYDTYECHYWYNSAYPGVYFYHS